MLVNAAHAFYAVMWFWCSLSLFTAHYLRRYFPSNCSFRRHENVKAKRSGLTRLLLKQTITITLNNHRGNFPFSLTARIFLSPPSSLCRCVCLRCRRRAGMSLCSVICDVRSNFDRQRHCAAVSSSIPHLHWHFPSAVCLAAFQRR